MKWLLLKRAFYAACNNILSHSRGVDEIIQLSLQETYCLPVLLYASPHIFLKHMQLSELKVCWNYRKIFNLSRRESGSQFIFGLGRLALPHLILLWRVSFYNHLSVTNNSTLYNLFWSYLVDYSKVENRLAAHFSQSLMLKMSL